MRQESFQQRLEQLLNNRWDGARQTLHKGFQALVFSLLSCAGGLGFKYGLGWPIELNIEIALGLAGTAFGFLLLIQPRKPIRKVAERLDRRFNLHEQLVTALEVSKSNQVEGVAGYLLEQANQTTSHVQTYVQKRRKFPWADLSGMISVIFLGCGILLLAGLDAPLELSAPQESLPQLAPPLTDEQFPEEELKENNEPQPEPSPAPAASNSPAPLEQQALQTLADALRDQSVTRPAAEALDQGKPEEAAQKLRGLADQAGQISPETRRSLGESLWEAAKGLDQNLPDLAAQLRENATNLQRDDEKVAQALEGVAGALENLGGQGQKQQAKTPEQGQGQGDGAPSAAPRPPSDQRQHQPSERLGVEGVPLDLAAEGSGDGSTSAADGGKDAAGGAGGFQQAASSPSTENVQAGQDPLRIPADLRDVVQEYFSPAP